MTRSECTPVLRRIPVALVLAGVLVCRQTAGAGEKAKGRNLSTEEK